MKTLKIGGIALLILVLITLVAPSIFWPGPSKQSKQVYSLLNEVGLVLKKKIRSERSWNNRWYAQRKSWTHRTQL